MSCAQDVISPGQVAGAVCHCAQEVVSFVTKNPPTQAR
jgi:hypothetical protein